MDDNEIISITPDIKSNKLKCLKCSCIPNVTLYNSKNNINIFSECKNKHFNISLLDEYIKKYFSNNFNNISQCHNCKKEKDIKICQFCNDYLCEECNSKHLTIEHIINNKISKEIFDNIYFNNIEKEEKFKTAKENLFKSIDYLKKIIKYYKTLEENFKIFMLKNLNEIILIKILLINYMENKGEEKLMNNIKFLLSLNELNFKTDNFNEFLLNNDNYILFSERYKGDKKDEEFEGKGEMEYFNGKYIGEWKNGLREGFGIYINNNGDKYIGNWKNNLEEGDGRYIYKNGDIYDGSFKEGKNEGRGILKFNNIDNIIQFYGEWKKDKKNGEGIIYYQNGDEIEGLWEDNIMNNKKVKIRYINGDEYIGECNNNKRNGKGIMKYKTKEIYNGEWKDDKKEGIGIYIFINNTKEIKEKDYGKFYWNGKYYDINKNEIFSKIIPENVLSTIYGKFREVMDNNGYGEKDTIIDIKEKKYIGEFKNDEIDGEGIMYYKNKEIYNGIMKNKKKEGYGEMIYKNGDKYIGNWKDDKREGEGKLIL